MRFSYKFGNVLGSVYSSGSLQFFPDGDRLISPVGNKLLVYDLKNGRSQALDVQLDYNVENIAVSPNGRLLLVSTNNTQIYLISMVSGTVLQRKDFKQIGHRIKDLQFSPDGKYYAVCGSDRVLVYLTPGFAIKGVGRHFASFKIYKIIKSTFDETTCLAWSLNSKLLLVGNEDLVIKIFPIDGQLKNVGQSVTLSGHTDTIVATFFANSAPNELNIYSVSRNGQLFVWESNYHSLEEFLAPNEENKRLNYTKKKKHFFTSDLQKSYQSLRLTTAQYNPKLKLLIAGFSNGSFMLYEMPDITLIHSLQLSNNGPITSIATNNSGQWIALGSAVGSGTKFDIEDEVSSESQLIVWEWESESFILKQSGYSNGVTNVSECMAYSPDATIVATGGSDGKVKLWSTFNGFCIATFNEHRGPITALEFVPGKNGKVLITSSLDGTVKAFDLNRYRNFRTLAAPSESKPAQFISLAIDQLGGDFIACGAHNFFEIFLWSLQTGRLLECLAGHESPVSGLKFSPVSNTLVSCSWDQTVRIWDLFEGSKCTREVIKLGSDALAIAFRGDGHQFAVATLNGDINFFDPQTAEQMGVGIEGKNDLGSAHYDREIVTDKNRYFSTLHYSIDGSYIMAGGKSKHICIYHVHEKILVKKITITMNQSMDGFFENRNGRKVAEFGFNLSTIKSREEEGSGFGAISLPGVAKSDFSERSVNPIIAVFDLKFSPTMRTFAFASTEGVMIYTLDNSTAFDPYQLDTDITPMSCRALLNSNQYCDALMQSLKLNDQKLIEEVIESVPTEEIKFICLTFPLIYVEKCLRALAVGLESTRHLEFYLKWCQTLLYQNGTALKNTSSAEVIAPTLRLLQQNLSRHFDNLSKVCEHNKYYLRLIRLLSKHHESEPIEDMDDSDEDNQMSELRPELDAIEEDNDSD